MNDKKIIIYISVVILIIVVSTMFVSIIFTKPKPQITTPQTTISQTTIANSSYLLLLNDLKAYAENMSLITALTIKYNIVYYPAIGITPYSAAFNKSMAFYKSGNSSALCITAFTNIGKAYYFTNKNSSISCTSQNPPFYNFSCMRQIQNPSSKLYRYITNLYSEFNTTLLSYSGARNFAGIHCNEYNLIGKNGTVYAQVCIDPLNGFPIYINNTQLGFSIIAENVSDEVNSTSLLPLYRFGITNVTCSNSTVVMDIIPFYNLSNILLAISAYSLSSPSNIPVSQAFAYLPKLNAGTNSIIRANWNSHTTGKNLIEVCSGSVCQSAVVYCS